MPSPPHSAATTPKINESKAHDDSDCDNDIPISLSHSLANSPRFVAPPLSPVKSVTTEINSQEPLDTACSREHNLDRPEAGSNETAIKKNLQTLDLFDAISSNDDRNSDEHAIGTPSECSDDVAFSTQALKSNRRNSGTCIQPSTQASRNGSRRGRRARTRSINSDESNVVTDKYARKGSVDKKAVNPPKEGLAPEGSPKVGNEVFISTKGFNPPKSPNPTIDTITTSSTSGRAERALYVPFLPKFLRARGIPKERRARASEAEQKGVKQLKPDFQDESSDIDCETEVTVHKAQQGRLGRPILVEQASNTVLGLKDMLRTTGPEGTENNPSPSRAPSGKLKKMFGEDLKFPEEPNSKRAGIIGIPTAQDAEDIVSAPSGLGILQNPMPTQVDGLRSHPMQRSSTVPTGKRQVGFWPTLDVEIKPEHRFLRQSIVSTPYPLSYQEDGMWASEPKYHDRLEATLTLVLNSQRASGPIVKSMLIPLKRWRIESPSEWEANTIDEIDSNFDDEKLFRLIKAEYKSMRWRFHNIFSARPIQSLNIISTNGPPSLTSQEKSPLRDPLRVENDHPTGPELLRLFYFPQLGRNEHKWVNRITQQPWTPSIGDQPQPPPQPPTLELEENWSTTRILAAIIAVTISSLLTTLLWIFLGVQGSEHVSFSAPTTTDDNSAMLVTPSSVDFGDGGGGYRGAGGRVQGGAMLGALVLMLGWTGVVGWVVLCWLV